MKKDHLPIWPSTTNKGGAKSLEVFYLKEPNKPDEYRVVDDAGCDVGSGEYVAGPPFEYHCNLGEQDVNENSAGMGYTDKDFLDKLNKSFFNKIEKELKEGDFPPMGCCPIGPKGHQGEVGVESCETEGENTPYDEIMKVLNKFETSQLHFSSESAREILSLAIVDKLGEFLKK